MSRLTITIAIDLPEGAAVSVGLPAQSEPASAPPMTAAGAGQVPIVEGPPGQCPKHRRPWRAGKHGPYCSAQDETAANGYCTLTPGSIYNGTRAIA
jgi:hypothetical protein